MGTHVQSVNHIGRAELKNIVNDWNEYNDQMNAVILKPVSRM